MPKLPQRKTLRLKNYNYSQAGYYFITICTHNKRKILCDISLAKDDALVIPTAIGEKVIKCWQNISRLYDNVATDEFCLMPNHIHGIIVLKDDQQRHITKNERQAFGMLKNQGQPSSQSIIRGFKSVTTRYYNKIKGVPRNSLWQKSFYDHIIRNKHDLYYTREYIANNPLKWHLDKYYV